MSPSGEHVARAITAPIFHTISQDHESPRAAAGKANSMGSPGERRANGACSAALMAPTEERLVMLQHAMDVCFKLFSAGRFQELASVLSSPGLVDSALQDKYCEALMAAVPATGPATFKLGDTVAIGSRNQRKATIRCVGTVCCLVPTKSLFDACQKMPLDAVGVMLLTCCMRMLPADAFARALLHSYKQAVEEATSGGSRGLFDSTSQQIRKRS